MIRMKKGKRSFLLLLIIAIITLLMIAIAWIPGAEKVVPKPVYDFAQKFYPVAVGVLIVVVGAFLFPISVPAAVALVVVMSKIVY